MDIQATNPHNYILEAAGRNKNLWIKNMILLVALAVLIFIAPLLDHLSDVVANAALILVVISGIFAAEYQKHVFNLLFFFGFLVLVSMVLSWVFPENRVMNILPYFLVTLSLIFSSVALVAHVSVAKTVEKSTVLCAINSYLLMGLTASVLLLMLHFIVPESFSNIVSGSGNLSNFIYFGFVTLSTLGYGDITPLAPLARSLTIFTALGGQLYLVIVMALIIGKYLKTQNQK